MSNLMTRANINDFLLSFLGLPESEVSLMPDYVKVDIVESEFDLFEEYMNEGLGE
tara:strand:+ start:182 stop:346 length:165 start_codon:yes stop_codon:yes gene_type:complete